ncbi:MAG: aminotransferase class I/II-fold pyridoxal phosphate-dependent enzyme [Bacteroidetes bacterium]|nr:aminotransferase class I/II-fold pyridoxal phosphate-dependent enzyme [Bacteroidota bacterium]
MSKLPDVGTTIFTVMSQMANEYGAINLAQGFPNFPIDPVLNGLLVQPNSSLVHQYAPMAGNGKLLKVISDISLEHYNFYFDPDKQIIVTAGATQALFSAIQAFVHINDEVIILDPAYDCYDPSVRLSGGIPIHVSLNQDYKVDWKKIEQAVNKKTKAIIINNPHNPAGTLWSNDDFEQLEKICDKFPELLVIADEVYEYIYFEKSFCSIKTRSNLSQRMVCVSSFGKTFHITGWKIGYIVGAEHLIKEIKKIHQFQVFCVNSIGQEAIANYAPTANYQEIKKLYQAKRDLFQTALSKSKFKLLPCEGSFFQLASYADISDELDTEFTKRLIIEHGVATIPTSVFFKEQVDRKVIRFCFAKDDETLLKSAEILCKI